MKNNSAFDRTAAKKHFDDGNYRDSLDEYLKLMRDKNATDKNLAEDWDMVHQNLQSLQKLDQFDELSEELVALHSEKWMFLQSVARSLISTQHQGFTVAGKFIRGDQRGGGVWTNSVERDRVRALQLMMQAEKWVTNTNDAALKADFYWHLGEILAYDRSYNRTWLLQELTDLSQLPDYDVTQQQWGEWGGGRGGGGPWGGSARGAPVDAEGNPVYYKIPKSWIDATNDGERWRWAMEAAAELSKSYRDLADFQFANFLHSQFGVQTMAQYGIFFREDAEDDETAKPKEAGPFAVFTLGEDETIARLATGVKRFKLPDEFNPIRLFQKLAVNQTGSFKLDALTALAGIFEDRQQYPKAAELWKKIIELKPNHPGAKDRLNQIVKPWGRFESTTTKPAGKGATIDFRFRNGKQISFVAEKIKFEELLQDVIAYLKSNPKELDWQRMQIDSIGYDIFQKNRSKFIGQQVAAWDLKLDPRPEHFDRRITVNTPLQNAGAYLVTAKMADGNTCHVILWVEDLAISRKPIDGRSLYYIADAVTGGGIPKANVEFFGWTTLWDEPQKRQNVKTSSFAEISDATGFVEPAPKLMENNYQWIAIARSKDRLAYLGFENVWAQKYYKKGYNVNKAYGITDRPIYRPAQTVKFKFWFRNVKYSKIDKPRLADREMLVKLLDTQGNEVSRVQKQTDSFAGLDGEFVLGPEAALGKYVIAVMDPDEHLQHGQTNFGVEEYKKPEFEVKVVAPEKPLRLGEKIPVKVEAKYYFGGAVQEGTVKYKVHRTAKDQRWYPIRRWDWLYGNGYWWMSCDSDWYPGFKSWGCRCPIMPWWGYANDPPELVLDEERPIGENGLIEFEIDTALAKEMHGDQDHEYRVTAEVVDASRRTIVGSGSVIVTRRPFAVHVWADRGYAEVGQVIEVGLKARTGDGKGVRGKGKLTLFKIAYDQQGKPRETEVQSWEVNTDEEGDASQKIKATEAGQFRLSYTVVDESAQSVEGGQLFQIIGAGFDSANFKYNDLEILTDKAEYKPGEKVGLLINTNRVGATVLLWIRPVGIYAGRPEVLKIDGKTARYELDVTIDDMPNFFVEATTIFDAKEHQVVREIIVPPSQKIVNVEIEPSAVKLLPGSEALVKLKLTDVEGRPFSGSIVMTMYDRAVEYISGGSNVPEIREFFWKWKRSHYPNSSNNLAKQSYSIVRDGIQQMLDLGVFGNLAADSGDMDFAVDGLRTRGGFGGGGSGGRQEEAESRTVADAAGAPAMMAKEANAFSLDEMAMAGQLEMVVPTVRKDFSDAAYWNTSLTANSDGIAEAKIKMPENLTSWKIRAWALGNQTDVGEATTEVVTAKNIMVRLQAPRFFIEKDEVVLSAIVHNYLEQATTAKVILDLGGNNLETSSPLEKGVDIPAGGETRVDWTVKVKREGDVKITMSALTSVESDAMQMTFPVFVHGMLKTESFSGVVRDGQPSLTFDIRVPQERRPDQTRLEVRYSPTLAGAMVDALPYLNSYPYGCTEQTLNRFLPTVVTFDILKRMKLDLEKIRDKRTNLNAQEIGDDQVRAKSRWAFHNPVFDPAEVELIAKKGVKDLTAMQCSDGGWGWFSGNGERSWPHTTAVVVHGLQLARQNGIGIVPGVLENGVAWLQRYQDEQVALLIEGDRVRDLPPEKIPAHGRYRMSADNLDAMIYMVLLDADISNAKMGDYVYRDRKNLSLYGLGMAGLAFDKQQNIERRDMVIKNLDQFVKYDEENQSAYIDLPNQNNWWYWYGDSIEANAYYLKLLSRVNPKDPKAAGIVKYLLNNRQHGTYWQSTRDTATCIEAMADYLQRSGEISAEMTVEVVVDGEVKQSVEITPAVLFQFDNSFVIAGDQLTGGDHKIELRRKGNGNLYANAYLTNFTLEDNIAAAGLEIKVQRQFYRLEQIKDAATNVQGSRGQLVGQKVEKYKRVPLKDWDEVHSGDLIEIELEIDSKNDYEYVIFDDMKVSGCEPVELRSGYVPGSLNAYVEFRDERVAFFTRQLAQGKHSFSYRMRAEIPGRFSALPTKAWAMYAPELRANSGEMKLAIIEVEKAAEKE